MKIIIIEDHPAIYHTISQTIENITTDAIISYHEKWEPALEEIKKSPPDFVITDIQIRSYKQLEIPTACMENKIPCMVYTGHVNYTILKHCNNLKVNVIVSKLAKFHNIRDGIEHLFKGENYRCEVCNEISTPKSIIPIETPKAIFTAAEESVIIGQIQGKSTLQLSEETKKSKFTIRNQRMSLMLKNDCSMEEVVRRYLFWHYNE